MTTKRSVPQINWSDSDDDFEELASKKEDNSEFADLLTDENVSNVHYQNGEQVTGILVSTPRKGESVAIDLGAQAAGIMDGIELFDPESGEPKYKTGDSIKVFVLGRSPDGYILGLNKAKSLKSKEDLEMAYREQIPVKGKVEKAVKGGFEVTILGKKAFCPVSRMDIRFISEQAEFIGRDYEFLITKLEGGGRNIVVDRAKILEQAREQALEEILESDVTEKTFKGVVSRMEKFGVFVTLENGLEGLVHISEISHIRISHPSDVLKLGETVFAKIKKIDKTPTGPKISLSIRDAGVDPWEQIESELKVGETCQGKVTKLQEFGAFVELKGLYEGLIHISEMSWMKKIRHPKELLSIGEMVTVQVKGIDTLQKRISLTMKMKEDDPWLTQAQNIKPGSEHEGHVIRLKDFGAIVELQPGLEGLLPTGTLKKAFGESYRKQSSSNQKLSVTVLNLDFENRRILLSLPGIDDTDEGDQDYQEYVKSQSAEIKTAEKSQSGRGSFGDILAASMAKEK